MWAAKTTVGPPPVPLRTPLRFIMPSERNHYRKPGAAAIIPADAGSTDANIAVAMGIPAVSIGAAISHMAHRLEETAEASTIIPGIKSMLALAIALTTQ